MKNKFKLIIALWAILLSACTSAPPIISSNQKLVETSISLKGEPIPDEFSRELTEASSGKIIDWQGVSIEFQEKYVSALGLTCRAFLIRYSTASNQSIEKRVACKAISNQSWLLIPSIVKPAQFAFRSTQ